MKTYYSNAIASAIIGSLFFLGCAKMQTKNEQPNPDSSAIKYIPAPPPTPKSGDGIGVIKKISKDKKFVELDHNDIIGIMEAMAMEYPVHSSALLEGIKTGDSVRFTLTKTPESQFEVTAISKK
jgi:Cu/Ag efflux protein CusF